MSSYPDKRAFLRHLIARFLSGTLSPKEMAEWVAFELPEHTGQVGQEDLLSSCEWTLRHLDEAACWIVVRELRYYQQCLRGERVFQIGERDNIRGTPPQSIKAQLHPGLWAEIFDHAGYRGVFFLTKSALLKSQLAVLVRTKEFEHFLEWFQVRTAVFGDRHYFLVHSSRWPKFLRELKLLLETHFAEKG